MKIAGRKNDGAWFRHNKKIKSLTSADSLLLATKLEEQTLADSTEGALETLVAIILDIRNDTGYEGGGTFTAASLASTYSSSGIPRQVWLGKLSWDIYYKEEGAGDDPDVYNPAHQAQMAAVGKAIRTCVSRWFLARRQVNDISNVLGPNAGNPGGIADANENT